MRKGTCRYWEVSPFKWKIKNQYWDLRYLLCLAQERRGGDWNAAGVPRLASSLQRIGEACGIHSVGHVGSAIISEIVLYGARGL